MAADSRRPRVTAAVIARDEEALLGDCLASLGWADEVLVLVDAATRDRTREVAAAAGARVAEAPFETFAAQRDRALGLATGDWVLFVDADERVTEALRDEVRAVVAQPDGCAGFWIPRLNYVLGRQLRGGGWYPDEQLRLLKRGAARYDPLRPVHEVPRLDGPAGHLAQPFVHLNYRRLADLFAKQERYVALDARRWREQYGGPPRARALLGQPARELARRLIQLRGYRDGWRGFLLAGVMAWYAGKAVWLALREPELRGPALRDPPPPAGPQSR